MKINALEALGSSQTQSHRLGDFSPQLTAIHGPQRSGKSALFDLAATLLFGKDPDARSRYSGRREVRGDAYETHSTGLNSGLVEGSLSISSQRGNFTLRREHDGTREGRLSLSAETGGAVDQGTMSDLLAGLSPQLLSQLYAIDFADGAHIQPLLSSQFASDFSQAHRTETNRRETGPRTANTVCRDHTPTSQAGTRTTEIDRRLVDQLVVRRDELALQIEKQISEGRRDSSEIERELTELDRVLGEKKTQEDQLRGELQRLAGHLATVESRLRYFSMEATLRRGPQIDSAEHQAQLAELDAEIARCRTTLSDLQSREAVVRRDLATVHADGTADNAASLADQRVTLSVLERLMDDLDAETALLARAHEPGRCIAPEAHARITPVAELLRQQMYTLCGQLTEQERAARRRQLHAESRHLSRSQSDLSEQLEHLLERRQELTHEAQLAGQPVMLLPQSPVEQHCQCEHHREFLSESEAMLLGSSQRGRFEETAETERHELRRRCDDVESSLQRITRERADLQQRWDALQQERAALLGRTSVDALREELRRCEEELKNTLSRPADFATHRTGVWRASDVLAQLTNGRLNQIRLPRDGSQPTIVSRTGQTRQLSELSAGEHDQVALSIVLAMISSHSADGTHLPLLLDEPFLRQSSTDTIAMASVLDEFARGGNQIVVFTGDRDAVRHFESLRVSVRSLSEKRESARPEPVVARPVRTETPEQTETKLERHIVRESVDPATLSAESGPRLRVRSEWTQTDDSQQIYYLQTDASLTEFPVLGVDTQAKFSALGIETVAQLLEADCDWVAAKLDLPHVSAKTVRLWQSHMSLMCFVAGVALDDAQVLSACDIDSPAELSGMDIDAVATLIERFLTSERGRRYAALRRRYSRESLSNWQSNSRSSRSNWERYTSRWNNQRSESRRSRSEREGKRRSKRSTEQSSQKGERRERQSTRSSSSRKRTTRPAKELRFLLERSSQVADAPSIGPKTAERLASVGIRSVADLLHADAASTAEELDVSHIKAETIATWQHQARLVCCIPELRGYGAQLLVGCGLTEPKQIAGATEEELFRKIRSFSRTTAGQRILRDGKVPNRDKIAEWIDYAGHMRPLEAA
ncbi:DUF4332 domain-containing protein [Adhaeretor mobilis]|uniref:DNA polymerase IV n=1 Tax=Adhaeretor mobilis TaxID=1930276 RepID=A0A517MUZ3_9BACT|nr:DUF4332 domain-containing protein [Adhaeretor mobilis]QDS98695.1 DNA polymerase IV [Adhaeretor mobilis]